MFMALADCSESPLFPLSSTAWNFKGTFMIKRRVVRRSDSNISILRTQGGTGLSLGRAQASFTNVASQGEVISIVGKSGPLTTALALASAASRAWPRCWGWLAIPMSLLDNLPMQAYVY